MTTGERLVEISTLTTGTAMDHFLNIAAGGVVLPPVIGTPSIHNTGDLKVQYLHFGKGQKPIRVVTRSNES